MSSLSRPYPGKPENQTIYTYEYNAAGQRTSKTKTTSYNGESITTEFIYEGDLLVGQKTSDGKGDMTFLHDDTGAYIGLIYEGAEYYYMKNVQGDIIGIVDAEGVVQAIYTYDAYGRVFTIETRSHFLRYDGDWTVGGMNPIRYRGYYYDYDTKLYYLNSRYYDPEVGRWISPEPNVYEGEFDENAGLIGYNVYAYCANNPVNNLDPTGEFVISTAVLIGIGIGALIGGVAGGVYGYNKAVKSNVPKGQRWKYVVGYGLGGAVIGGVIGGFVGYGVGVALGAKASSGLVIKSVSKALSSVSRNTMHHIMQSKHAWGRVLRNATWNNVKGLINTTMKKGATTLINKQGRALIYEAVRNNVVVRYAVIDGVIKISDAWVKTR